MAATATIEQEITETPAKKVVVPTILPGKPLRTANVADTKQFRAILNGELRLVLIVHDETEGAERWLAQYEGEADAFAEAATRRELLANLTELIEADELGQQVVDDQAYIANELDGKHSINASRLLSMYAEHPGLMDDGVTRVVQGHIDGHIAYWKAQDAKAKDANAGVEAEADEIEGDEEE